MKKGDTKYIKGKMAGKTVGLLVGSRATHVSGIFGNFNSAHNNASPFTDPCPQGSKTKEGNLLTMSAKSSHVASSSEPLLHWIKPNTPI